LRGLGQRAGRAITFSSRPRERISNRLLNEQGAFTRSFSPSVQGRDAGVSDVYGGLSHASYTSCVGAAPVLFYIRHASLLVSPSK
jgi:hypothetical protein